MPTYCTAMSSSSRHVHPKQFLIAENEGLRKNAERYLVLRQADVDTIHNGGLVAGLTPDNIVINGSDLDERVDAVLAPCKVTP